MHALFEVIVHTLLDLIGGMYRHEQDTPSVSGLIRLIT